MRILKIIGWAVAISVGLCGCETEVYAPVAKGPYPVVYCVLNKNDTAHYVRLTKTFSGPVDATVMAKIPDSLYYKNARVFAEMGAVSVELLPTNEIDRDPGVFFTGYNQLFKTTFRLCGRVVIHIYLPDYGTEVLGTINLLGDPVFVAPDTTQKKVLSFYEDEPVRIIWNGLEGICQTVIRFKYLEVKGPEADTCHIDWLRHDCDFAITPVDWLTYLKAWMKVSPAVTYRKVLGVDILVSTGNSQLLNYMTYKDWVIDVIDRPYSNLVNAYGLVASRVNGELLDYQLNRKFLDTLANSALTRDMKFVVW